MFIFKGIKCENSLQGRRVIQENTINPNISIMKKLLILLMACMVITACKKDDDEDNDTPAPPTFEEKLVGQYALTSSTFMQDVTIYNVQAAGDTVTLPEGSDATFVVSGALLDDSPCDNILNTLLDMRSDYTLYYICSGEENELQAGTWSADEAAGSAALNVNTEIGPVAVTITDIVISDINMTGNIIGLPVPVDYSEPVGETNIQFIDVSVDFMIVN